MRQKLLFLLLTTLFTTCCFGQILQFKKLSINPKTSPASSRAMSTIQHELSMGDTGIDFNLLKKTIDVTNTKVNEQEDYAGIFSMKNYMDSVSRKIDDLRDSLDKATDPDTIEALEDDIKTLKLTVTARFLSTSGKNHPFWLGNIKNYDVDSLNAYFYNQSNVSAFQSVSIQHAVDAATFANAEFASFLFGPIRMGVVGSFKTSGDTNRENAVRSSLQKILYSGGAINLNFSLPLFFSRGRKDQAHFGIFGQINNGINPGINDSTGNTNFSNDVTYINQSGLSFHFDAGSNDQKAKISFDIPIYYAWGSNNAYSQFGIRDYSVIKLKVGVIIQNLIDLQLVGPLWSSSKAVRNLPFNVALQFSPTQMLGK